ncbi:MAG: methyltransferase [Gemmatirosa sp.]
MTLLADTSLLRDLVAPRSRSSLRDRVLAWRDAIVGRPGFQRWAAAFPLTRPIAHQRSRAVFDLCAGFVYTQTLDACVRLDLLAFLAERPRTPAEVAVHTGLPPDGTARLLGAATALRLVQRRSGGRVGLGPLGAPLLADPGVLEMIEHNRLLYDTLRDPVAVLRGERAGESPVARYFAYGRHGRPDALEAAHVAPYSALMSATVAPLAAEVLDVCRLDDRAALLDVGGGEGGFVLAAAARHPHLRLALFDLPAVAERARERVARAGLGHRVTVCGGNFHADPLPGGADVVTLVRILLDHDDRTVRALLARVRAALSPGGQVIVAEPLAGAPGAEVVGDVYFAFYLAAMSGGRARRTHELRTLLAEAGFRSSRVIRTRYPVHGGVIVGTA